MLQEAPEKKADATEDKKDDKATNAAETDGKASKAEAAQDSLKAGDQGKGGKAEDADTEGNTGEGAEMDVEHEAKPEAAGEAGDV